MAGQTRTRPMAEVATEAKLAFLGRAESYPHRPARVECKETHMSWVFLAGDRVYKMKKPVRYAFLDFSTLAARETFVAEEIRLNRRLAPDVYLGAVPLTLRPDGGLCLGGSGPTAEWLVAMRRLPDDRMLETLLAEHRVAPGDVAGLGGLLARFYAGQPSAAVDPAAFAGRFATEHAETARVLRAPDLRFNGPRVAAVLVDFEAALDRVRPLLDARARAGRIVDGHGDLRPEHVFLTAPPVIIDALEFDRGLRLVDPFDEIAFLGLEAARAGAGWLFDPLRASLASALGDDPPDAVLAFYWRYRALLRARLALLHLTEPNPRTPEKWRPLAWTYIGLAEEADLRCRSPEAR